MNVKMDITTTITAQDKAVSPMELAHAVTDHLFSNLDIAPEIKSVGRTFLGNATVSFAHEESAVLGDVDNDAPENTADATA